MWAHLSIFPVPSSNSELCTFEAINEEYRIKDLGVLEIAKVVHVADVASDIAVAPEARGVEAQHESSGRGGA